MVRNVLLTLIGLGFVALSILPMAMGNIPWTSPDPWTPLLFFAGCAIVGIADIVQFYRPAKAEVTPTRVVLRYDRVRLLSLGLASAGWLAAGIVGLSGTVFPVWLAWVLVAFAGFCTVVLLAVGVDGRAKVVVDAEGIADYRGLAEKIPWRDVEAISFSYLRAMPSLSLRLRNPAAYAAKQRTIRRWLGHKVDPLHIIDFNLGGSLGDIAEAIARFAPPELVAAPSFEDPPFDDE